MVERLHRTLKQAIRCHDTKWTESLPVVLRACIKEDLNASCSEMVFGKTIVLPGEFFESSSQTPTDPSEFLLRLRETFRTFKPTPASCHSSTSCFVHTALKTCCLRKGTKYIIDVASFSNKPSCIMGKKLKGGRRQILQLEEKKPPKVLSKSKVKHIIHHNDIDNDTKKSNESDPSPLPAVKKDITPLESQIEDFFKEIDAMTLPKVVQKTEKNATISKADTVEQSIIEGCNSEPAVGLPPSVSNDGNPSDGQNTGAYCVWQEIHDSSTGYNYYWNVQTNEVTWDCPVEYTNYIQSTDAMNSEKDREVIQEAENADEKNKLEKKNAKNEGSVIPISYYGKSSSSDDSSDNENILSKSNKKQDLAKTIEGKKTKGILKVGAKCKLTNEEELSGEVIGPQLPPEFRFPQSISKAEESNSETLTSRSENERDVEIDSVSPLKSTKDLTEKPSQSNLNEFPAVSSQLTSSEISLEDNEKNCQKVHKQTGDGNPDSPEKRIENALDHSVDKGNNSTYGFRPVVEYDSFTDEDEDISNTSPSKQFTNVKCLKVKSFIQQNLETTNKSTTVLSTMGNEINSSKRKNTSDFKENAKTDLIKKPKTSNLDIDSLFTAHTSRGKYGLGWQKEENTASVQLHATSTQDQNTHANKNDYEVVNFIKSDDVLDFQELNEKVACDKANNISKDESMEKNVCEHSKNLETDEKCNEKKPVKVVEESFVMKDMQKTSNENVVGSSTSIAMLKDKYRNIKNKRKKDGNFSNKVSLVSIPVEEDLDEIDRALCEALDAKKAAKNSTAKPSSPSPSPALQDHIEKIIANTSLTVSHEKNATTGSKGTSLIVSHEKNATTGSKGITSAHLPPGPLTEKILETSSALIDKLNFLLSAQSEVASLSGFFVQLQTRFLDWQAGGLDGEYFMARLKEAEQYIQQYETSLLSHEWICQWDRVSKRYFYINRRTRNSQWTYPEEINSSKKSSWVQSRTNASSSTERDNVQTVSSSSSAPKNLVQKPAASSFMLGSKAATDVSAVAQWILKTSPPPPPPGVDSPPPPPPISPPKSPPPPPPDSTEKKRKQKEPEDMDIEDSNDSNSFLFVSNRTLSEDGRMQYLSMAEHSSLRSLTTFPDSSIFNAVSSTSASGFEGLRTNSKLSQSISYPVNNSDVNTMHWSNLPCSSQGKMKHDSRNFMFTSANANNQSTEGKNLDKYASSGNGVCSSQLETLNTTKPGNVGLKKDTKKPKIQPPLGLKNKHISSLVQKWAKIKKQQSKEDEE
ncbi:WW domain-containing protein [Trichonephila clavata]|uniref:WW domain-containing protein n=1 Tax=Trichonephila clavata TaxID=2740835 RepID=A0A8X6G6P4_TRICU|nr:WW domain-containing protein [Trichonephila clavata]